RIPFRIHVERTAVSVRHSAASKPEPGRGISRRGTGAELYLYRGHPAEDGIHLRYSPPEHDRAPDLQSGVRTVIRPRGISIAIVFAQSSIGPHGQNVGE